jgi:hypothetical protein
MKEVIPVLTGNKVSIVLIIFMFAAACATAYKAQPLPFRSPSSYSDGVAVAGITVAAEAFTDRKKAEKAFGFDVRGAGILPVEVVFDNGGPHSVKINAGQTFLEDERGNLWPILDEKTAYDRTTKYAQTRQIFKEGAYSGFLGATAGAIIGAAIGIVSGGRVGEALGRGAALGAAAGATIGGAQGYAEADDARRTIINDLDKRTLENKPIPRGLAYGFLFFPGEAHSAKELRLQLVLADTGMAYGLRLNLEAGSSGRKASAPPPVVEIYPDSPDNVSATLPALLQPPTLASPPPPPPAYRNPGGSSTSTAPTPGDQTRCREWKMIERSMEYKLDPSTGANREVPFEKWDWVEVPCSNRETGAAVQGDVNTGLPPEYVFPAPPAVVVIPGSYYVYMVPDIKVDIPFYHGYWYRPHAGRWYWARSHNGPWVYLASPSVPRVLIELAPDYRKLLLASHRIPYERLHANWERWERERYWHRDRNWQEGGRRH